MFAEKSNNLIIWKHYYGRSKHRTDKSFFRSQDIFYVLVIEQKSTTELE